MKKVYILLTYTGTVLSKVIKIYTRDEFSHVSISLDKELNKLYSFGRLNPYNPFIGGFVHEGIHHGTFKRFKKTRSFLYSLEVTNKEFYEINKIIKKISKNREKYHFNILGLFLVAFKRKRNKKDYFYCAEFVKFILEKSGGVKSLPEIIKPDDFLNINNKKIEYKGLLSEYMKKARFYEMHPIG